MELSFHNLLLETSPCCYHHYYFGLCYSQKLSGIFDGSGPRSATDCTGSYCPWMVKIKFITRMIKQTSYRMNFVIGSTNTITCLKNSSLVSSLRISGNAASDKNIKDGVCAQIEKNFAKAKWKVFLRIHLIYHYMLVPIITYHYIRQRKY